MADKQGQAKPSVKDLVERVAVNKRKEFGPLGSRPVEVYDVMVQTKAGNSGTFVVQAAVYEDDAAYAEAIQEFVYQLDKLSYLP